MICFISVWLIECRALAVRSLPQNGNSGLSQYSISMRSALFLLFIGAYEANVNLRVAAVYLPFRFVRIFQSISVFRTCVSLSVSFICLLRRRRFFCQCFCLCVCVCTTLRFCKCDRFAISFGRAPALTSIRPIGRAHIWLEVVSPIANSIVA